MTGDSRDAADVLTTPTLLRHKYDRELEFAFRVFDLKIVVANFLLLFIFTLIWSSDHTWTIGRVRYFNLTLCGRIAPTSVM